MLQGCRPGKSRSRSSAEGRTGHGARSHLGSVKKVRDSLVLTRSGIEEILNLEADCSLVKSLSEIMVQLTLTSP